LYDGSHGYLVQTGETVHQEVSIMLCSFATKLGESDLAEIESLEKDLGAIVIAFSCHPLDAARLTPEQLVRVEELEHRLGIALVAVNQAA
jgi:hypothetical protein